MEPMKPRRIGGSRPEEKIQKEIIEFLKIRDWLVRHITGNAFNFGWPDLFISHDKYKQRWVEIKLPGMKGSRFTDGQLEWFPKMCAHGAPVWVLTAATEEEYRKLWGPPNWYQYLGVMK